MTFYYDTFPTPFFEFSAAVDENGALVATAFGGLDDLRKRFTRDVSSDTLKHAPAKLAPVRKQVAEYFAKRRRDFDLPLAPGGTAHQQRVWAALRAIPFGETRSYGELARALGSSPRAVGRANATNPISLIVPCHRVIGADGSLTGFAFGEDAKRKLLEHEGALESPLLQLNL